jgi:hypothetical protein
MKLNRCGETCSEVEGFKSSAYLSDHGKQQNNMK